MTWGCESNTNTKCSAANPAPSTLESSLYTRALPRDDYKIIDLADFNERSLSGNQTNASLRRDLDDWNVEDL